MKIVKSTLRAIIERVTEIVYDDYRLFVFEYLDQQGCPHSVRIQNWECDNVTSQFNRQERREIEEALYEHYKCNANK
jgi:hypothetical protein